MVAAAGTYISCGGLISMTSSCPNLSPRVALWLIADLFGWQTASSSACSGPPDRVRAGHFLKMLLV
jgi:hypothetical protein